MSARLIAMLDQAAAADRETTSLIERACRVLAEAGETPEHVPASEVHRRIHERMRRALLGTTIRSGESPFCPHLRIDAPSPVVWLAWAPERLRCIHCADQATRRIKGTPEDFVCDACGRYTPSSLKWGVYTLPPILASIDPPLVTSPVIVHYGLCRRCEA